MYKKGPKSAQLKVPAMMALATAPEWGNTEQCQHSTPHSTPRNFLPRMLSRCHNYLSFHKQQDSYHHRTMFLTITAENCTSSPWKWSLEPRSPRLCRDVPLQPRRRPSQTPSSEPRCSCPLARWHRARHTPYSHRKCCRSHRAHCM